MQKNIELLLELQTLEQRLKELNGQIGALPKRLAGIEATLSEHQAAVERRRAAIAAQQSERKGVERQIEALKLKLDKSRAHATEVKTNQEYKALKDEIAFHEAEIGRQEEQLLRLMESADGLNRELQTAEGELARERERVEEEKRNAAAGTAETEQERAALLEKRERVRRQVDETALRRFDRVFGLRGQGLSAVEGEVCGSCRVRLRPQFLQELAVQTHRLFICESCGRILYIPEQVNQNSAATADSVQ